MAEEEVQAPPPFGSFEEISAREPLLFLEGIRGERGLREQPRPRFDPRQRSPTGFLPKSAFEALGQERGEIPSFQSTVDPDELLRQLRSEESTTVPLLEETSSIPSHEEVFSIPRVRGEPLSEAQLRGTTPLIRQAIDLVMAHRAPMFQSSDFNVGAVLTSITDHVDEDGLTSSPQEFTQSLGDVIATGLADARSIGIMDPEGQVLNTLAAALIRLRESNFFGEKRDPANLVAATNAIFNELSQAQPETVTFPVEISSSLTQDEPEEKQHEPPEETRFTARRATPPIDLIIDNVYGADLDVLAKRNPSDEELDRVRREQGRSFVLQGQSNAELRELVDYLRSHVKNPVLRDVLVGDANERIRSILGREVAESLGHIPTELGPRPGRLVQPLPAGESVIIERPLLGDIELGISDSVRALRTRLFSGTQDARKATRQEARNEIDRLNFFFKRYNLKQRGSDKPLSLSKGNKSAEDLIRVIDEVGRTVIGNRRNIFTLVPPEALGSQQDQNSVLADIMRAVSSPPPSISRNMLPHPERISEFGEIMIRREGKKREIIFGPGTQLESVMKLANAIVQEGGLLEGISGREMLNVEKDEDPGEVVSFFLVLLNNAAGEVVRVLYTPKGKGEFVGGFLESMFMTPQLTPIEERFRMKDQLSSVPFGDFTRFGPRRGGGIVSGVAGAVGNVANLVGTVSPVAKVVTAPIKAVANVVKSIGSLFGF